MSSHLQLLTDTVREFVDRSEQLTDETDLALMAVAGERLRRVLACLDDWEEPDLSAQEVEDARGALERYDGRLRQGEAPAADDLPAEIDRLLADLDTLATTSRREGDGEALLQLAADLAESLWLGSAACRGGRLSAESLQRLAERTRTRIAELAPRLPGLWEKAVVLLATYGVDEDRPFMDGWLEELAQFAPSRADLLASLAAPTEERIAEMTQRAIALRANVGETPAPLGNSVEGG